MEKHDFATAEQGAWWFVEPDIDQRVHEGRVSIGSHFGWADPLWYTDQAKLEELYRCLEVKSHQLLAELDHLAAYDDQRLQWVNSVLAALASDQANTATETAGAADSAPPTPSPGPDAPAAPAKVSAFAKKPKDVEPPAAEVLTVVHEAVQDVLSALTGEATSDLAAEFGLTEEQIATLAGDAEFEQMVREEAALLLSQSAEN